MKIMHELKSATKMHHAKVEELAYVNQIMGGTLQVYEYQNLILKNYLFHYVVEKAIERALTDIEKNELDFYHRKKLGFLFDDLEELDMLHKIKETSLEQLPTFEINSISEALGALYVIEGATLGGAIIKRELEKNESIKRASSMFYYTCYGAEIGKYWKAFMTYVATKIHADDAIEEAVGKAQETFDLLSSILAEDYKKASPVSMPAIAHIEE